MIFGIASIVIDTGIEISFWFIKNSVYAVYNGIYCWKYGNPISTDEKLDKLLHTEKENQLILLDTLNRLKIQELEITRLKKKGLKIDSNIDIKLLEKYTIIDDSDL